MAGNTRRFARFCLPFFRVMRIHNIKVICTLIAQGFLSAVIMFLLFVITFMRSLRARRSSVLCGRPLINFTILMLFAHLSSLYFYRAFSLPPSLRPSCVWDARVCLYSLYACLLSSLSSYSTLAFLSLVVSLCGRS